MTFNEKEQNLPMCVLTNGTSDAPVAIQPFVPDLSAFTVRGGMALLAPVVRHWGGGCTSDVALVYCSLLEKCKHHLGSWS